MKKHFVRIFIALLILVAFTPATALAQDPTPQPENHIVGDQVVIGNTFRLERNEKLDGNILVIGGTTFTAPYSTVNGDLVLIGGTLAAEGEVNGDIVAIGGAINLGDTAVINGDLSLLGASLQRSSLARINGSVNEESPNLGNFNPPERLKNLSPFSGQRTLISRIFTATLEALLLGVLAVVVGLLMPHNLKNIAATIVREPWVSGGIGVLTILVAPIVLVLLIITILLIPVSLLGFILLGLAMAIGYLALGYEVGQRMAALFKTTWHASIAAGIGTLLLALVTGLVNLIPCVGWIPGFIAVILGLGAVITSRVGSEKYANELLKAIIPGSTPTTPIEPPNPPPIVPGE